MAPAYKENDTYILGVTLHEARAKVDDKRLEEMVYDTAKAALDDVRINRTELDHITIAACDELDGRSISSMLLAAPSGAYLKDEIKTTDSGLMGLCLEVTRIRSGRFHLGLLVSWNKSSIAPFEDVMRMRCEPFYTRPIGLNMSITDGLFAGAMDSASEAQASTVAASYGQAAAKNPRGIARDPIGADAIAVSPYVATPLREGHRPPVTDGAIAMVVVSGKWLNDHPKAKPLARLSGIGWCLESYQLGHDRMASMQGLKTAFSDALSDAGMAKAGDLDVIEIEAQTAYHDIATRQALALSSDQTISPSGGPFAQNPYFCAGLISAAEAVLQVAGQAGPVQAGQVKTAAAIGFHGFAHQGNIIAIFEEIPA